MHGRTSLISMIAVSLVLLCWSPVDGAPTSNQTPSTLSITVTAQPIPADGRTYPSLVVAVNDLAGDPTITASSLTIYLSSSQNTVATVPPSVELAAGHAYVLVNVTTTQSPGTVAVTAASGGLKSASANLQTVGGSQEAAQVALSVSPSKAMQSFVGESALVAVQLMAGSSMPAYSNGTTQVIVTSSNTSVVEGTITLTVPQGSSYAYSQIRAKNPGTTTFTALSSGLASSSAALSISALPVSATITADPNPVAIGGSATIKVAVSLAGQPLPNASVSLASTLGAVNPTGSITDLNGQVVGTFVSRDPGVVSVVATISHPFIGSRTASVAIIVPEPTLPVVVTPLQLLYPFIPVIVGLAIIAIVVLSIRRILRARAAATKEQ